MRSAAELSRLRWRVAWILFFTYLAVVAAGLYLKFGDDPQRQMPREVLFFFVPPFAFLALCSHLTGIAPGKLFDADRAKDPFSFWMLTGCYWLCAAGSLVVGIGAWLGFWA